MNSSKHPQIWCKGHFLRHLIFFPTESHGFAGGANLWNLTLIQNKKSTNWLGQAKYSITKIQRYAIGGGISTVFSNFDKCPPEVAGDVISGVALD